MSKLQIQIGASYSTPSDSEIYEKVVTQYEIGSPMSCEYFQSGLNDTYKITSSQGIYFLRIYRKDWRSLSEIKFEVDALRHLHAKGANVILPIPTQMGDYVTTILAPEGERHLIVTSCAEGDPPNLSHYKNAMEYGRCLAKIHQLSNDFSSKNQRFTFDFNHFVEQPLKRLEPYFEEFEDKWATLKSQVNQVASRLIDSDSNKLDYGLIHGDAHFGNVNQNESKFTLFDFDLCGFGPRVYDLAVFKMFAMFKDREQEWWIPFLDGYREVRDISQSDLSLIDCCGALRHLWEISMMANELFEVQVWNLTERKLNKLLNSTSI